MRRRGSLALAALFMVGSVACDPIEVIPDPAGVEDKAPEWDLIPPTPVVVEGVPWAVTMTATDEDGDSVTYSLKSKAEGTMQIDAATGAISWTPSYAMAAACKERAAATAIVVAESVGSSGTTLKTEHRFDFVVLNDLDEDGDSDVDSNNAAVDPDIDGDGVSNAEEATLATDECVADTDGDGVKDGGDNCVLLKNAPEDCDSDPVTPNEQCDNDDDGKGNICDVCPSCALDDPDDDGVCNCEDNCPEDKNPKADCDTLSATPDEQCDADDDGVGDLCDSCPNDAINDPDLDDRCAFAADGVTVTDNCNGDTDGDGAITDADEPSLHVNPLQEDADSDDLGDACDACPDDATNDGDDDGYCEDKDNCPGVKNDDQADMDGDKTGDACDDNIDGDCKLNVADNCPTVDNCDQADNDGDLAGDACDDDDDDDGVLDAADNCPLVENVNQVDIDGDGVGFQCDTDVVVPATLHRSGSAAQRVSGYAAGGTVAIALESRETNCANATICPTPGVLVVDASDVLYMKRYDSADADSAWLDVPFGAGGELGEPFVSEAGVAYFGWEKGASYDVRKVSGVASNTVFPVSIPTSAARFRHLPSGLSSVEVRLGTGNPGQYQLEDLSGPNGEPKVLKTAAGNTAAAPPLGPFEIFCGKGGCRTATSDNGAAKMGAFRGLDGVLYMPFVAANGEVEVMAYGQTSSSFQTLAVPSGTSTTPLKATDLRFIAEDVISGTPWYCMRKTSGAQLINASGGQIARVVSTNYFYACDTLDFSQSPTGVWFIIGQGAGATDTSKRRLSYYDPSVGGTAATATDIISGLGTTDELSLLFAGAVVYVHKRRSDGQAVQPEMVSAFEVWNPGTGTTTPIGGADLYDAVAATNAEGWIGVLGRDAATYTDTENLVAKRYKPGVTTTAATFNLRSDSSTGTLSQKPLRAWVSPEGDVWAFYQPPTAGANVLTVFPTLGTPVANTSLATSTLSDGARVTFHPAGTLVGIRTNAFSGKLQYAIKNASGISLADFSPAVTLGNSVHSEFLKPGLTQGAQNHWVAYPSSSSGTGTVIAKFVVGNPPTLVTEAAGLVAVPFNVKVGADLNPWFMFETATGFSVASMQGGEMETYASDLAAASFVHRDINGRVSFWGLTVQRTVLGAISVCRLPTLPPLPSDVGCWTAAPAGGSAFPPAWGPFVDDQGIARAVSVIGETDPTVTLWQSVGPAAPLSTLP